VPGQAYAVIVRSRYAHGVINAMDTEEARAMPGVLGVYTGPDLSAAGMKPMPLGMAIPTRDGTPMHRPARSVLTSDRVRYVGDPVAIVVAETAAQAKDAAKAVVLDVETLPAVTRASEAAAPGARNCTTRCRAMLPRSSTTAMPTKLQPRLPMPRM
jgi:aerobic carbon-monoxide dehydrogenase large subunit